MRRPGPAPSVLSSALVLALALVPLRMAAEPEAPLSAIDWLSQSVAAAPAAPVSLSDAPRVIDEPPVARDASTGEITVSPLDRPSPDGAGLLAPAITGLPAALWAGSNPETLVTLLRAERADSLPALRDLLVTLLLARADPPLPSDGSLFLARVDRLLDIGALEPAQALLEAADRDAPEVFRRWFDVSLLTGTEDAACAMIRTRPGLASTYPARIFCLARNGDWPAAALTLSNARALGAITPEDEALLSRFLDPDLFEGAAPLPPPSRPSPLVFRLREAVGEALPTAGLPRAFAHADLRPTAAWRNRIEAAERLARAGAIPGGVLLAAYTEQTPAASGGVWDRARAIQTFDAAIAADDPARVAAALPSAWQAMQTIRAEVAFAGLYAEPLAAVDLPPDAASLALRIGLLAPGHGAGARAHRPAGPDEALLLAVARGDVAGLAPTDPHAAAIVAGFTDTPVPEPLAGLIRDGRVGEAILRTIATAEQGLAGDSTSLAEAIAALRGLGLEGTARSLALQYLILDRPA
jgi:hypothetical protein